VKLLIAHGADVNLADTDNETAMMLVMQSRNEQVGLSRSNGIARTTVPTKGWRGRLPLGQ